MKANPKLKGLDNSEIGIIANLIAKRYPDNESLQEKANGMVLSNNRDGIYNLSSQLKISTAQINAELLAVKVKAAEGKKGVISKIKDAVLGDKDKASDNLIAPLNKPEVKKEDPIKPAEVKKEDNKSDKDLKKEEDSK